MSNPWLDDRPPRSRPRVLIVGGCDVQKRIDLMRSISDEFSFAAVGSEVELAMTFAEARFPYFYFPLRRGSSPLSDLRSLTLLRELFRLLRPDIVHTFATKPSVWGRLAARSAGVPIVIGTLPGLGSLYTLTDLRARAIRVIYERLQRTACRVSDLTIFQNEHDAREFTESGIVPAETATVIPGSGVRTDLFDPARFPRPQIERVRAEVGASDGDVVVTMIARVIRSKGVLVLAEAAERLRERHPQARFVLVGPVDRDSLDRLTDAEFERVVRAVAWLGERDDVGTILASSEIFVLPSFYREGVPRVLLEAAAMGRPLVATRVPGCEDVVVDGTNGFLIPPRDADALARAVSALIENPELRRRFGAASRALAVERFDLAAIARRTAAIYRDLLRRKLGRPATAPEASRRGVAPEPAVHREGKRSTVTHGG